MHVHQIIEKTTGMLARCSLAVDPIVRTQDIPIWMLDDTVCRATRAMSHPFAALEALAALRALLWDVMAARASARAARGHDSISRSGSWRSPWSTPPSPDPDTGSSTRPSSTGGSPSTRRRDARLEHAAASDAARADRPDDPPAGRARRRRDARSAERRR